MTLSKKRLWSELRWTGLHFRGQAPIGRYVADFACQSHSLIVEVDGAPHELFAHTALRDQERDAWLTSQGYRVLRSTNAQGVDHVDDVLSAIRAAGAL